MLGHLFSFFILLKIHFYFHFTHVSVHIQVLVSVHIYTHSSIHIYTHFILVSIQFDCTREKKMRTGRKFWVPGFQIPVLGKKSWVPGFQIPAPGISNPGTGKKFRHPGFEIPVLKDHIESPIIEKIFGRFAPIQNP